MKQDLLDLDAQARQRALQVHQSFIMQAPAGSGKTEVLTQRFLALLAVVEHPEQILALTFTKKAAAEMRYRLLHALHLANETAPDAEPALSRWRLAQAVLARNEQQQWQLLSSPHRLRLYTIDSLCATLVKQSPLAVPFAGHAIVPDAQPLYAEAVETIVHSRQGVWIESLQRVLAYFNTDYGYFHTVLEGLLASRQRWLADAQVITQGMQDNRFSADAVMQLFQQQLQRLQGYFIEKLCSSFAFRADWDEFWALLVFASTQISNLNELPSGLQPRDLTLQHWQDISQIILKKDGDLRRRLDKNSGFPATARDQKQRMALLMTVLGESSAWCDVQLAFILLQNTPVHYTSDPQHLLAIDVFMVAVAAAQALDRLFLLQKSVDYVGLSQSALTSLGEDTVLPSDVLLRFDYQIQHILMDEFQDTSIAQMQLFERMVTGWQANDGRSLFFVGDPMQSIYGFRDADVNLFYEIKHNGLADIPLEFLQLRRNFRTQPQLVNFLQTLLAPLFPAAEDPLLHQVTFSEAVPAQQQNDVDNPLIARLFETADEEASWVVDTLQQLLQTTQGSVAIVVRKKSHVPLLTQYLRQADIAYTAVELDPLWAFTSVRDLFHLVAVVCDTPQKYHFFAVCRSPWVGLGLSELELLASHWAQDPGLNQFANGASISGFSNQSMSRLRLLITGIYYFQQDSELTVVEQVRGLWMSLLGPEITPQDERQPVSEFWALLAALNQNGRVCLELLQQKLEKANTSVVDANARVEIMTIHKSKGLEFETVFVPCLQDFGGKGSQRLLEILNFQLSSEIAPHTLFGVHQTSDSLMQHPQIKKQEKLDQSVARFLKKIQQQREYNELSRLFYVAVTRAEQQVYLSAVVVPNAKGDIKVNEASLLGRLMSYFTQKQHNERIDRENQTIEPYVSIDDLTRQTSAQGIAFQPLQPIKNSHPSQRGSYWPAAVQAGLTAIVNQQVGQLIHLWLSKMTLAHLDARLEWRSWFENMILSFQWQVEDTASMVKACLSLVQSMINDEVLRWLLQPRDVMFREVAWQIALPQQETKLLRPDLVFFDQPTQKLWIIDFKITHLDHQDLTTIRQTHAPQLEAYGDVFQRQGFDEIELAIYQPQAKGVDWWHWSL